MGREKSRVRLGGRTLLGHVRASAAELGLRARVIRRDAVARCGPMGGIYTGLARSRARMVMFLACDMPFVSTEFLRRMMREMERRPARVRGFFARDGKRVGFPCVVEREAGLVVVKERIERGEFSLQGLAEELRGRMVKPKGRRELMNINTPQELENATKRHRRHKI